MKTFIFVSILALASAKPNLSRASLDEGIDEFEKEFHQLWSDKDQEAKAAETLKEEEEQIKEQNAKFDAGESTFQEELHEWSDLPTDEFEEEKEGVLTPPADMARATGYIPTPEWAKFINPETREILDKVYEKYDRQSLPASFNALDQGLVTETRNQKSCGSCSAFAATSVHETCLIKAGASKTGMDLSEQQLVDCAYNAKSANGCGGAWIGAYPDFIAKQDGVNHEADYPYLDRQPNLKCQNKKLWSTGAKIVKSITDYSCSEAQLQKLVMEYGSVSTALYASDKSFGNYKTGIYDACSSKKQNHAVAVIGWGTENGIDYWLIKNSWGSWWGNKGLMKIKRGVSECGIGEECSTVMCEKSGVAQPAPEFPKPPPIPPSQICDISNLFGPGITGTYTLRVWGASGMIVSECKCENSKCSPKIAGPSNACVYICGKQTC